MIWALSKKYNRVQAENNMVLRWQSGFLEHRVSTVNRLNFFEMYTPLKRKLDDAVPPFNIKYTKAFLWDGVFQSGDVVQNCSWSHGCVRAWILNAKEFALTRPETSGALLKKNLHQQTTSTDKVSPPSGINKYTFIWHEPRFSCGRQEI